MRSPHVCEAIKTLDANGTEIPLVEHTAHFHSQKDHGFPIRLESPDGLVESIPWAMHAEIHVRLRETARDGMELVDISRTAEWFDRLYDEVCS